jgi:hypothetical protein
MLLAQAMLWTLVLTSPDGVTSVNFENEQACQEARQQYESQFIMPREHRKHKAECIHGNGETTHHEEQPAG